MDKMFVFYFESDDRFFNAFLKEFIAEMKEYEVVASAVKQHSLYEPIKTPGPYHPNDCVLIILGQTAPDRTHFDFLPPKLSNGAEPTDDHQMPVIVLAPKNFEVDYSKIMVAVREGTGDRKKYFFKRYDSYQTILADFRQN